MDGKGQEMNFNVSSFDSKYRSDIKEDIAHVLQSDSSESLKRSSSSDYIDDADCREKMQTIIDKRFIDGRCIPRINIRTGGANDTDSAPHCHRVVKSISFNDCFSNNPGTSEHTLSYEIPATITHSVSEDPCQCGETNTDPCQKTSLTNIIQTHRVQLCGPASKNSSNCYTLGEKDIDDIISKFSSRDKPTDVPSTTPSNLPGRDASLDRKRLMQRINDLEAEKLDGEKKQLEMKVAMLTLSKEKDALNDEFMSLQEQILAQHVTDNGKTTLEKRVVQLEKINSQAEKELQSLKSCMVSVKNERDFLQKKLLNLEEIIEEQKEKHNKHLRDKEKWHKKVAEANYYVVSLQEWRNTAVSAMEITKNNVGKFSELLTENALKLKTVRSRNRKLRKKLKKASSLTKECKSRKQVMMDELRELRSQLEQVKCEMGEKSTEIERSHIDLFETRDMNVSLQKRLEDVAESKCNHTRQSNDIIESLEKELSELKLRMETISEDHHQEIETLRANIDTEITCRNFMIKSYRDLEGEYSSLFRSALDFRQVMTAVVQGTNFASGI